MNDKMRQELLDDKLREMIESAAEALEYFSEDELEETTIPTDQE